MRVNNNFKLVLATVLAVAATAATAAGTDNSQSIAVSTTVNTNCVVSSGATLSFAAYDPVSANATTPAGDLAGTGSFTLKCTKGSTTVNIGLGLGSNAVVSQRKMKDTVSGDLLNYNLFQPTTAALNTCPGTTAWDDSGSKLAVPAAFWTNSATKTISVCGTVPGAQDVSAGSYSDTVVIDVTF